MPHYILTGAPGSGKTAILRRLELDGHPVVEEAATDVIALQHALDHPEPWRDPGFADRIVRLQRRRQLAADACHRGAVFFDRSPVCTLALSRHLGREPSRAVREEVDRVVAGQIYDRSVLFVDNLGFVEPTAARRITFEDSLAFEALHEATYLELGFTLVRIPPAPLPARVALVERAVTQPRP
ncbi:AAA family ATPase [Actinoplanes sp. CA-030573]|uniref:AAA family ATPase n=1 Tax=Actinoplanes sp. CA-030573 TaxID=3239898 RepID=UPI003D8C03AD